ncbi:HK97 gp10 family phage protein [Streptosporangium sp. NPDC000239]|uniref:HK97 gp10 family phage protein n=1 Tax=Streptosporangium sp. NPDC000239 TaxID=3154248 RepID=UPI00331E02D0
MSGGDFEFDELLELKVELGKAGSKAETLAKAVVAKVGHDTVAGAQALVLVDTGNLKNSIGADFDEDGLGFTAGPTANYGADVEYGTAAHVIVPRDAKALWWPGAEHPVKRVRHPGTAPQPYMRPAFEQATAPLEQVLAQLAAKALEE